MLDDLKFIHHRDSQDALGIAEKQYQQLKHQFEGTGNPDDKLGAGGLQVTDDILNVVYAGMGGSALAALLCTGWPDIKVPFEVCRRYGLPAYVGEKTLVIVSSYSGNTEETLAALHAAEEKGARLVVISGGGKLAEIARQKNYPLLEIPDTAQPRFATFYNYSALVVVLQAQGLLFGEDPAGQLHAAADFLKDSASEWLPTVPVSQNPAKKLALELAGKSPVIYAGSLLSPAAYKWKISFNENAKNVAWWNELPEFDHNELIGWTSHPIKKPYEIVELRSNLEHPRIRKRFEAGERLLSGLRPTPNVVEVQGGTVLEQLLWAVNFGDFVSIYLAMLNNVDPTPVDLVEKFKKALDQ